MHGNTSSLHTQSPFWNNVFVNEDYFKKYIKALALAKDPENGITNVNFTISSPEMYSLNSDRIVSDHYLSNPSSTTGITKPLGLTNPHNPLGIQGIQINE